MMVMVQTSKKDKCQSSIRLDIRESDDVETENTWVGGAKYRFTYTDEPGWKNLFPQIFKQLYAGVMYVKKNTHKKLKSNL